MGSKVTFLSIKECYTTSITHTVGHCVLREEEEEEGVVGEA